MFRVLYPTPYPTQTPRPHRAAGMRRDPNYFTTVLLGAPEDFHFQMLALYPVEVVPRPYIGRWLIKDLVPLFPSPPHQPPTSGFKVWLGPTGWDSFVWSSTPHLLQTFVVAFFYPTSFCQFRSRSAVHGCRAWVLQDSTSD